MTGVFRGARMIDFVPLHLSAVERSPELLSWIQGWYPGLSGLNVLKPEDWFDGVLNRDLDHCLWASAPAASKAAVEQLCLARLKRPDTTHIIIIPRLLTSRWRKPLSKTADVVLTLPLGGLYWGVSQHDPLLLAVCFPSLRTEPWRLKGTLFVERMVGSVWELPPCLPVKGDSGLFCMNFSWALGTMPQRLVRSLLH